MQVKKQSCLERILLLRNEVRGHLGLSDCVLGDYEFKGIDTKTAVANSQCIIAD